MQDPILNKLKSDAGIVFTDLWRALLHQPPLEDWQNPRLAPAPSEPDRPVTRNAGTGQTGLCYFHLN